jgi:hypothetical protein
MDNLAIYNELKETPQEALKPITGGRLKGMSDINPMWRIMALTKQFGPCGVGWKYEVVSQRIEEGANGEKAAFVDILLYYKQGEGWSDPVPGSGGSMFVTKETKGLYTDDECFKKALTDAIGVAGKALGLAATVYWKHDRTKYNAPADFNENCQITESDIPEIPKTGTKADQVRSGCEVCDAELTQAAMNVSKHKFNGKVLCLKCQKEEN